jgi:hypothetical protein
MKNPMKFFRENAEAKKAKAIRDNSMYGENLAQAQTGIPGGMRSVASPAFASKKQQRIYKQTYKKIKRDKAEEQRRTERSDKQFFKGHHLRDKANLSKPGKAPSPYVNEKKAARIDKRSDKAFNKSIKIENKYL